MSKAADIGGKRLISLAPTPWVRWVTGDPAAEAVEVVGAEFQWVSRANDALIRVKSPTHGAFLVANELQVRADRRMPRRMRAYAALAEERYGLPVYPVVVNILPTAAGQEVIDRYDVELLGLRAVQEFRVINLWEVDAELAFKQELTALLPFVPILRRGGSEPMLTRAVVALRADESLAELEPLLAFFASFVLSTEIVRRVMRWDMEILRESPWYNELVKEGLEQGLIQGREEGREEGKAEGQRQAQLAALLQILHHRFGDAPYEILFRIDRLDQAGLVAAIDQALDATSLPDFDAGVSQILNAKT
jgi:predicted transposase YdaD